jgi:hypothetical protein
MHGVRQQPTDRRDFAYSHAVTVARSEPVAVADPHPIHRTITDGDALPVLVEPHQRAALAPRDEHRLRLDQVPGSPARRPRRHDQQRHLGLGRQPVDS